MFTTIDPKFRVNVEKPKAAPHSAVATEEYANLAAEDMIRFADLVESPDDSEYDNDDFREKLSGVWADLRAAMKTIAAKDESPNYDEWIHKLEALSENEEE